MIGGIAGLAAGRSRLLVPVAALSVAVGAVLGQPWSAPPPVSVPISIDRDGADTQVHVEVRINGHGPFQLLLDTGSSTTGLTANVLDSVGAARTGEVDDFDLANGKSDEEREYRIRSWSLGGTAPQGGATVSRLSGDYGGDDGLLGSDLLSRYRSVTIDWAAKRLVLVPRPGD